jgi:hypothetical protein
MRGQHQGRLRLAQAAFWLAAAFLLTVAVLHVIDPGLDPRWRTVSEYSIGPFGWLMNAAFLEMGVASIALTLALWPFLVTRVARLGAVLLSVWGVCSILSAFYPTDSMSDIAKQVTSRTGAIHSLIGLVGILSFAFATLFTARELMRHPAWAYAGVVVAWATIATWLGLAVTIASVVQMALSGGPGPASLFGIGERVLVFSNSAWTLLIARQAAQALAARTS